MNMMTTIRPSTKPIFHQSIYNNLTNNNEPITKRNKPSIYISTNPSNININTLSQLYISCNHSPHRFPSPLVVDDVNVDKLGVAVSHSNVVVSVFAKEGRENGLWGRIESGELVGFGRAVSDLGLTASIFDVMVIPTLRRLGIGRMIVQRILRMLTNKGVYDISALCTDEERLFFAACGFGDDLLGSTTMTYSKIAVASSDCDDDRIITRAGRKMLLSPPSRRPFTS